MRGGKEEWILSREMTAQEEDTGSREANHRPRAAEEDTVGLCCHLEVDGSTAAMTRTIPQVCDHPLFSFPIQQPHCSSSSQEMGLEKTSLSNQRS